MADWLADYQRNIEKYPVKPTVRPGDILSRLSEQPPFSGETMDKIFSDFEKLILPAMMHWSHPMFGGYFPASRSEVSLLAEMLIAGLGAQCMSWLTSPAATELEERMLNWLRDSLGLPAGWSGVIQDTASSSTLVSLLTAREVRSDYQIAQNGFTDKYRFRVYASEYAHSSVDKAVRLAGMGQNNLVKIPADTELAMIPEKLEEAIRADLNQGYTPLAIVTTLGTTATTAVDPLKPIGEIASRYGCWHHVDAAYAGTALLLPEFRWMSEGMDTADTFVFNPHKWMFVHFDCSAYFVRDSQALLRTMSIAPEYLRTPQDEQVNNYRDWGIPLGRRFRALKLWFVLQYYGISGLQNILRRQISLIRSLEQRMREDGRFDILAPVRFTLICFRYHPPGLNDEIQLNRINEQLLQQLNDSGRIFLSHTKINGKYTLRFVPGNLHLSEAHVRQAWEIIRTAAKTIEDFISCTASGQ